MARVVFVRRRRGNAGLVRNILHGTGAVVGGVVGAAAGGIAAGYRSIAGSPDYEVREAVETAPDAAKPSEAVAPKFFPEAEVDDMLEEIEDMILRRVTDTALAPECRSVCSDLLVEFNKTFRGE